MPKVSNLSHDERLQICMLHAEGWSYTKLAERFHVGRCTIIRICTKERNTGSVDDKPRSGRPKRSTAQQEQSLVRYSRDHPRLGSRALNQHWRETGGPNVTARTVRLRLQAAGLMGRVAIPKPILTAGQRQRRLQWANQHADWNQAQWDLVLFTDETILRVLQTSGGRYVRRRVGEELQSNMLRPQARARTGQILVWAAVSGNLLGPLIRIKDKTLTANSYLEILKRCLPQLLTPGGVLMQDNAPPHRAGVVTTWLQERNIAVLDWPANSPDCNPLENLWGILKGRLENRVANDVETLWAAAKEEWAHIPDEVILNVIDSMPRRVQSVISQNGGITKY